MQILAARLAFGQLLIGVIGTALGYRFLAASFIGRRPACRPSDHSVKVFYELYVALIPSCVLRVSTRLRRSVTDHKDKPSAQHCCTFRYLFFSRLIQARVSLRGRHRRLREEGQPGRRLRRDRHPRGRAGDSPFCFPFFSSQPFRFDRTAGIFSALSE